MTIFNRTASDTITFTQTAVYNDLTSIFGDKDAILGVGLGLGIGSITSVSVVFTRTASDTIIFTQPFVDADTSIERTASDTLVLTQAAPRAGVFSYTASNTITFVPSSRYFLPFILTASHTLNLTQGANPGVISRTASNSITFAQASGLGVDNILTASHTLAFTQSARPGILSRTASHSFDVTDLAGGSFVGINAVPLSASNTIVFSQTNNRFIIFASSPSLTGTDVLTFTQRAIFPIILTASNAIVFTQAADGVPGKSGTHVIEFIQTVVANHYRSITASNTISFSHGFSSVQFRDGVPINGVGDCDVTKNYAPIAGGDVPVVRPIPPAVSRRTDVVFSTPSNSGCVSTDSITLRTPNFGDRDRNSYNRINRESRGGSLTIFRDPKWPKNRTLVMDFSGIKDSEVDQIISFLETTLGQEVTFRDWNNRIWTGIIVNPNSAITRTGVNRNDIALEMEINSTDLDLSACNVLVLSQSNAYVVTP